MSYLYIQTYSMQPNKICRQMYTNKRMVSADRSYLLQATRIYQVFLHTVNEGNNKRNIFLLSSSYRELCFIYMAILT